MTHIEWLKERQTGIGGSDVAAILGLSPYKTARQVWEEKTAEEPIEIPDNEAMKAGRMLEEAVAQWFADETGLKVEKAEQAFRHPEKTHYIANVDRIIVNENGEKGVLECKTASGYAADNWENEVPLPYYLQLQHYLNVLDLKWGYIAVLIDGRDFRHFYFELDTEILPKMESALDNFWEHVLENTPPPAQNVEDVIRQYPQDTGESVTAISHIENALDELKELKAQIKELEEKAAKAEFKVKEFMGDASTLLGWDGTPLATWKASKSSMKFDSALFKAEQAEMFNKYQKEVPGSRRFLIKGGKK